MSLKRAVIAAAILLLAVPGVASAGGASDSPGTDGVLINGSKLVTAGRRLGYARRDQRPLRGHLDRTVLRG